MKLEISPCNQSGARLLLALALLIVTYMMLTPSPGPIQASVNDKAGHALAFFVLSLLSHAGWARHDFNWRFVLPLLAYGIVMECIQYFIPHRFFSSADILADTAGILVYICLLLLYRQYLSHPAIGQPQDS